EQTSRLARQEVALAKAELAVKGKRAGIGAGMFGTAGALGFYVLGALAATAILALATAVAAWLAALVVTAVLAAIAGIAALQGKGGSAPPKADGRRRKFGPLGRRAPAESPHSKARSWIVVLKRTSTEFKADNLTGPAAALPYYGILAISPALIALVSILGLI